MNDVTDVAIESGDDFFEDVLIVVPYDEGVNVKMTKPMKEALQRTAAKAGFTMSDLVRHLITTRMSSLYPEYEGLYAYFYEKEKTAIRLRRKGVNK